MTKQHILAAAAATLAVALSASTTAAFTTNARIQGSANVINDDKAALFSATTESVESSDTIISPPSATTASLDMPPYNKWEWNTHHNAESQSNSNSETKTTHSINYLSMGDSTKPALLLVHGFGASSYHFRYNIPELAKEYHVYAFDLLGFGWSDKPIMDYDASVWRDQIIEFVDQIIFNDKEDDNKSIAIAGNSLGGYSAMYAASDERLKKFVRGCILLNSAGQFRPEEGEEIPEDPNPIVKSISSAIQRLVIACSFVVTKQPARIEQILKSVYPDSTNVDSALVESIRVPALNKNAAEVFYRVIAKNGSGPMAYVDDIIKELECPVLLAWGEKDPWIRPAAADKMQMLHAQYHGENGSKWMKRVSIDAGHCPHDENPAAVNKAILGFAAEVF
jgi:pimeloyl-ACP methyl ester carboxylesterase